MLDGHALNPGDLSWEPLQALGECVIHERTPPTEVLLRAAGSPVVLTNKTVLGRRELEALPTLRYVGVLATGTNVVDLAAARTLGVAVTNVPAYSTASVAQMTFALLLELALKVGHHSRAVRAGRWSSSADFCFYDAPLLEVQGLTLGIVGFGEIGLAVSRIGQAFGMTVMAHTPRPPGSPGDVRFVGLEELLRESDVVSLHCPLTDETRGLLDARRLSLLKPSAYLLNTARGPLVDESALAAALEAGRLAGAGLDVLAAEPPALSNPLLRAKNCVITPHIAWATRAARGRLLREAVENVRAFLQGTARNRVEGG